MTERAFYGLSGRELAAVRMRAGLSQTRLAELAGIGRHAVSYWENKPKVGWNDWAPKRMFAVLGIKVMPDYLHSTRARGHGVLDPFEAYVRRELARLAEREVAQEARRRVVCGARNRKGTPCRLKSEPGKRRCKFHGGKSTGPKTEEGRRRIAEAQRQRWKTAAF